MVNRSATSPRSVPTRVHRLRHSEHQPDEMGVVNMQIEHRPADFCRIVEVGQPGGIGNHPFEMPAQQPAVVAAADRVVGKLVLGEEGQHVADHEQLAGLFGRIDHPRGIGRPQGDRLLAEDVLARLQRGNRHRRMRHAGGKQQSIRSSVASAIISSRSA